MSTETIFVDVETQRAQAGFTDLAADISANTKAADQASGQFRALADVAAEASADIGKGKGYDEIKVRIRGALDTAQEFGASAEDNAENLKDLNAAAKDLGIGVAGAAKVMEKFSDEAESGRVTAKDYALALDIAKVSGERLEDAAKLAGMAASGQTDALRKMDKAAAAAADRIDQVTDKEERARLITLETSRALARQNSITRRLTSRYQALTVRLGPAATGLKMVGAAGLAAAGVVGGALVQAIRHYISNSAIMQRETKRLSKAWDEFKYQVGGAIVAGNGANSMMGTLTSTIRDATKWVKDNQATVQKWARMALTAGVTAGQGIGMIVLGISTLVSGVIEGTRALAVEALHPVAELGRDVAHILEDAGIISRKQAKVMEDLANATAREQNTSLEDRFGWTLELVKILDTMSEGADNLRDKFKKLNDSGKAVKLGPKKAQAKAMTDAQIAEVNRLARHYLDVNGGLYRQIEKMSEVDTTITAQAQAQVRALGVVAEMRARAVQTALQQPDNLDDQVKTLDRILAMARERRDLIIAQERAPGLVKSEGELQLEREIELERKRAEAYADTNRIKDNFYDTAVSQSLQLTANMGQAIGAMIAQGDGLKNVGDVLKLGVTSAMDSVIPIWNAYAAILLGAQTLNPFAVFAATAGLGILIGAAKAAIGPTTTPGGGGRGSGAAQDAITAEAQALRSEQRREAAMNFVVIAQFGTDTIRSLTSKAQRQNEAFNMNDPFAIRGV